MIIFKKYTTYAGRFVLFLTVVGLTACSPAAFRNTKIEGNNTAITGKFTESQDIESFLAPYKNHINRELDSVLAYAPITYDKSKGKWQSPMSNMLADATLAKAGKLLYSRKGLHVDACLLNHGGIRSIIAEGDVTARTAYEVMPFENSLVVVALKGEQLLEMAAYIAREQKPHPLSGMTINLDSNNNINTIEIQGKPLDGNKLYYIATIDYLYNGGDKMDFLSKGDAVFELDYKLRDLYIDYFKEIDTLPVITNERIVIQ